MRKLSHPVKASLETSAGDGMYIKNTLSEKNCRSRRRNKSVM